MPKWVHQLTGILYSVYGLANLIASCFETEPQRAGERIFRALIVGLVMWLSVQLDRIEDRHA